MNELGQGGRVRVATPTLKNPEAQRSTLMGAPQGRGGAYGLSLLNGNDN